MKYAVVGVIGRFIVLRQGNACRNTVRVAADHVIGRVAVGVDAGIYPYLEWVLSFPGQLHHCSGAVRAAFPCLPGRTGGNAAVPNREAAVRAYDCLVADLAGTLRALDECHINHAPRFLLLQGPFFVLDGYLCLGYNMLNKGAGR